MAHLGGGKMTEVLGWGFYGLAMAEDFKIIFGFRNVNYFFLLFYG